jgi:hypothetical protein
MRRVARPDRSRSIAGGFGQDRIDAADQLRADQQAQASLTVAGHALDAGDCWELLCMLGLREPAPDTATPRPTRLRA